MPLASISRRPCLTLLLVCALALAVAVVPARAQAPVSFATAEMTLYPAGQARKITVELADDDAQRARGLMFRTDLAADHGMLFDFKQEAYVAMWMKNTLIPLDMVFFSADGRVEFIREYAVPGSLETIQAPGRTRYVLELAGGTVAQLGLKVGDRAGLPLR